MNVFTYVIYDELTGEVFRCFDNERDCVNHYNGFYSGFMNVNWMAVNLTYVLKNFYHIGD